MKRLCVFLITGLFLFAACQGQQKNLLPADEFEKAIQKKEQIQLLDVRTPGEYEEGHLSHSLLANWNEPAEFERRVGFLDKDKPVYVYCLAGGRSHAAAEKLRKQGFSQVFELQGGVNAWKAANKSLEGSPTVPGMSLQTFQAKLSSSSLILVDVGAEWCPPCKKMEPVLQQITKKMGNSMLLLNVDGGHDREVLGHYSITQLPVFMVFKNGKLTWRKDGVATEEEILQQLQ